MMSISIIRSKLFISFFACLILTFATQAEAAPQPQTITFSGSGSLSLGDIQGVGLETNLTYFTPITYTNGSYSSYQQWTPKNQQVIDHGYGIVSTNASYYINRIALGVSSMTSGAYITVASYYLDKSTNIFHLDRSDKGLRYVGANGSFVIGLPEKTAMVLLILNGIPGMATADGLLSITSMRLLPNIPAVPELANYAMMLAGLALIGAVAWRRCYHPPATPPGYALQAA